MQNGKERMFQHDYYSNITRLKFFAPAAIQSLASLLMISRRMVGGAALLLKNLAFRSFQIVQLINIVREAMVLRYGEALQDHRC
jgi:hypothetical protein